MSFIWYDKGVRIERPYTPSSLKSVSAPHAPRAVNPVGADQGGDQGGDTRERSQALRAYGTVSTTPPRAPEPLVRADQIMSAPLRTLNMSATLEEAFRFFHQHRFRHVPIVDDDGALTGVLSDRDVLRQAATSLRWKDRTVGEVVRTIVLTTTRDTGIREIARVLFEERIGSMPILDDDGALVGIITRSDILRALVHRAPLELWI